MDGELEMNPIGSHVQDASSEESDGENSEDGDADVSVSEHYEVIARPRLFNRKDMSVGRWLEEENLTIIESTKGKIWTNTGIIRNSKTFCFVEETIYLLERGSLILYMGNETNPASVQQAYSLLDHPGVGCTLDEYSVYAYLRRLGYILQRHGISWTLGQRKHRRKTSKKATVTEESSTSVLELNKEPSRNAATITGGSDCEDLGALFPAGLKPHQIIEPPLYSQIALGSAAAAKSSQGMEGLTSGLANMSLEKGKQCVPGTGLEISSGVKEEPLLKLSFDVFPPDSRGFRKTEPGQPSFSLCIPRCPPSMAEFHQLSASNNGVPVKFAAALPGVVSIFSFDSVQLPVVNKDH